MTPQTANHSPRPTLIAGGIIVALAALSNVSTFALPVPAPVVAIGVVLAAAAIAALSGMWMRKPWGRWLGAGTLVGTILLAAPGIVFGSDKSLAMLAIVTVGLAAGGVILLLLPSSRGDRNSNFSKGLS